MKITICSTQPGLVSLAHEPLELRKNALYQNSKGNYYFLDSYGEVSFVKVTYNAGGFRNGKYPPVGSIMRREEPISFFSWYDYTRIGTWCLDV